MATRSRQSEDRIKVECSCGAALMAPKRAVGKRVKCPRCRRILTVPQPGSPADRMLYALADEEYNKPAMEEQPPPPEPVTTDQGTKLCPSCNGEMAPEAVFCIRCGYHLERGVAVSLMPAHAGAAASGGGNFFTSTPLATADPPAAYISIGVCFLVVAIQVFLQSQSGGLAIATMAIAGAPLVIGLLVGGAISALILMLGYKIVMRNALSFGDAFQVAMVTMASQSVLQLLLSFVFGGEEASMLPLLVALLLNAVVIIVAYRMFLALSIVKAVLIWLVQFLVGLALAAALIFGLASVIDEAALEQSLSALPGLPYA